MLQFAVQLWTLRDLTAVEFSKVTDDVAALGYQGVELAGYGNAKSAADAAKALGKAGLRVCGAHVMLDDLAKDFSRVCDEQHTLGNDLIVIPWIGEEHRSSAAQWKSFAALLSELGQKLSENRLKLAYHNHSFEFDRFEGETGLELLWKHADPHRVLSELDVYWVRHGGHDPVQWIHRLNGRVARLHLKDMAQGPERRFAPVGSGILDFPSILRAAQSAGIAWGIVEQDDCYGQPPLQAVRASLDYLKRIATP